MPLRAAIYARLSQDRNADKHGIAAQLKDARARAAAHGWTVVGEYVDPSISAAKKNARRPEYNRLVADYAGNRFDVLIVWDLDRLTRQPRQLEDWIDAAEDRHLRVVTLTEDLDLNTPSGRTFARFKVANANEEAARTSARVKRNIQARREAGEFHGGNVPYGYRQSTEDDPRDRELIVYEPEAALIREAVKRIFAGDTSYSICRDWNQRGITTGRKTTKPRKDGTPSLQHWRQGALRAKLLNPALIGQDREGHTMKWDPILQPLEFDRLNRIFRDPARNVAHSPGRRSTKYSMAGGLTVCGRCGHRMYATHHRDKIVLICTRQASGPGACGRNRVEHDALEEFVWETLLLSLQKSDRFAQRQAEPDDERDAELERLDNLRANLNDKRDRVNELYVEGAITKAEHSTRLRVIDDDLEGIARQVDALLGQVAARNVLDDGTHWQGWTPAQRRAGLQYFWSSIRINPHPAGLRSVPRRMASEPEEEFTARRREYVTKQLVERVEFIRRGSEP